MNAQEFTRLLCAHLRSVGYFCATEVPLVERGAFGRMRADVWALKCHEFARKDTRIYEVKVSRSDFLNDVNKGKAEGYGDFARRVFYAVPSGLCKVAEVPEGVGLITLSRNGNWSVAQAPKPTKIVEPPADLLLLVMARGLGEMQEVRRLAERIDLAENVRLDRAAKGLGWEIARRLAAPGANHRTERALKLLKLVEDAAGKEERTLDEQVRAALSLLAEAERFAKVAGYLTKVAQGYGVDERTVRAAERAMR